LIASNGPPAVGLPESEIIAASKMLAEKCKAKLGDRLKHLGSVDVVRDMELMRKVFGEKKFNYLGKSYGTYLGLVYASMYPNSVGRVVLDGVIDPQVTTNEVNKTQAIGFELALDSFLTDCITKVNCFYQGDLQGARDEVSKIMSLLRANPLKLNDARLVTESILVLAMVSSLYNTDTGWPELNRAFKDAVKGKGIRLQRMADDYVLRDKNGAYNSNENEIAYIVNCVDREDDASIERTKADSIAISKIAPHFGPYIAWSALPCDYWPYPPIRPPVELSGPDLPPFLMVGTTRDPATPYQWAQSVAKRFPSAILITADGDGHTGHGRGSACVDNAVDAYLLKGTLPGGALTCTL
jgi:pimeloyl-ACP methyl ester carboxylesterase